MNFPHVLDLAAVDDQWRDAWLDVGRSIEQAATLPDPLMALAQLSDIEQEANKLAAVAVEDAVRRARAAGKTWAEIAAVTGVQDRQAAWRRWTDRGIRLGPWCARLASDPVGVAGPSGAFGLRLTHR